MPKQQLIEEEWLEFSLMVMPPNAPAVQRIEMRRAFYAGAHALLCLMQQKVSAGTDDPTEADLDMMQGLSDELAAFNAEVAAGRA